MSKPFAPKAKDVRLEIAFESVTKTVGESTLRLSYDASTGRFDLRKDGELLVSSVVLGDCVSRAERHGATFSEDERKVSLKPVNRA